MSYNPLHEDRIQIESLTIPCGEPDHVREVFQIVDTNGQQERVMASGLTASDAEVICCALNMWYAAVPSFRRAYGI